jgi:exonuclease III
MKIGTINLDWLKGKKNKKEFYISKILEQELDFLIVTETLYSFNLPKPYFKIHSEILPSDVEYEGLNYGEFNKGELSIRTAIFSKHELLKKIETQENHTSVAGLYNTTLGETIIFGTVIGTWGIQKQNTIAKVELDNFQNDVANLLSTKKHLILAGDFNTSFIDKENRQLTIIQSRKTINEFCTKHRIYKATKTLHDCIDHIFISESLMQKTNPTSYSFLDKSELKDNPHKGIVCYLDELKKESI